MHKLEMRYLSSVLTGEEKEEHSDQYSGKTDKKMLEEEDWGRGRRFPSQSQFKKNKREGVFLYSVFTLENKTAGTNIEHKSIRLSLNPVQITLT